MTSDSPTPVHAAAPTEPARDDENPTDAAAPDYTGAGPAGTDRAVGYVASVGPVALEPGGAPSRPGDDDRMARIALTWLAEPGNRAAYELVRQAGATAALRRVVEGDAPDPQLRAAALTRMAAGDPYRLAEVALRRAERLGARVVVPGDDEWPRSLQDLARLPPAGTGRTVDRETSPPLCLWVRGPLPVADAVERSVAVVGARAATSYGVHVATDIAYGLAEREWTVVSGGAYGIDAAAHRAALTAGGITVAVLACGVDRPYPMGNAALFDRIAEDGLLISEWPPGAEPLRHRFLIRNRVIAAVTAGTVVVEAAARSGARQTLHRALRLGRRAMVVPGPVTSALSVGCHELLRDNPETRLVTGFPHVLEEVGRIGADLAPVPRGPEHPRDALDDESARLLEVVPLRGTASPDQLSARSGLELRAVLRRLAGLEHLGLIRRRDGGFCLSSAPRPRTKASTQDPSPPTTAAAASAMDPSSG